MNDKIPFLRILLILFIPAVLLIGTCGAWDLRGPDEGRYVQIAKELLHRNNWFLLTVHGEPYNQKPPLPFWMFALMLKLNGGNVSSWLLRLPSVIFALLTVFLTYAIGRRLFGPRAGLLSALILLCSPLFLDNAPQAKLDMIFTGWIVLSLYPWLTRPGNRPLSLSRTLLLWGALSGAFFTKGPLAVIIVLAVLVTDSWKSGSWSTIIKDSRLLPGMACFFLLIGAWLWIQSRNINPGFMVNQVRGQTINRFLHGSHGAPVWYYLPRLFTVMMIPWSLLLIPVVKNIWKKRGNLSGHVISMTGWFLLPFILLCLAHGKRQEYMLPLVPPLSLLIGWKLDQWADRVYPRLTKFFGMVFMGTGASLTAVTLMLALRPEWLASQQVNIESWQLAVTFISSLSLFIAGIILLGRIARSAMFLVHTAAFFILFLALVDFIIVRPSLDKRKSTRDFALEIQRRFPELENGGGLTCVGKASKPEYHVYGQYHVIPAEASETVTKDIERRHPLLIAREKDARNLQNVLAHKGYSAISEYVASGDNLVVFSQKKHDNP